MHFLFNFGWCSIQLDIVKKRVWMGSFLLNREILCETHKCDKSYLLRVPSRPYWCENDWVCCYIQKNHLLKYGDFVSSKMNWVLTLPLLLKMSVGKLEPWLILKGFSSSEVEIYLYNFKAYTALYEILFSCMGWCPQFLDMLNKLQKQVLLGCWSYICCISWTLVSTLICSQFTSFR